MNTTTRPTMAVVALLTATAFGTLAVPPSQAAVPAHDRIGHKTSGSSAKSTTPDPSIRERPCFTWRGNWNVALDGPEPTCPLPQRR